MANTDFKKMVLRNLEFKYPRLNTTYRYSTAEKRSEECAPTAQGATYSISWEMGKDEAAKLHSELKAHYETCKTKGPFSKVFGMKKLENGNYEFKAKKNGVNREGNVNKKPEVVDGMKKPLADLKFWSGSKGNIIFTAYPSSNPQTSPPEYGITLMINSVQVTHAVYGGGTLDDFDEVPTTIAGGVEEALDDFGIVTSPTEAPAADVPAKLEDDEIPF